MSSFEKRKFSINRNTGEPKPGRRFSIGGVGAQGEIICIPLCLVDYHPNRPLTCAGNPESNSKIHRQFRAAHEGYDQQTP
jgi:hypothetical protein